ncbi:MAG TPA: glycosyltransferase family 4 protein [Vicinamibacterales bacterium]|nr:glycosyltransferase family 4 protein [Vicinamibacterales bacterium]
MPKPHARSRPLRALFVSTSAIVGGAEHSLLLLLRELRQMGVDAHVAVLQDGPLRQRLAEIDVDSTVIPVPDAFRRASRYDGSRRSALGSAGLALMGVPAAWELSCLARGRDIDVMHSNGMKAHTLAGLAGRLAAVPVVWHARDFPPPGWAGRAFLQQVRVLPSLVLANSCAVRSSLEGRGTPVMAIHNPVDLTAFHPCTPRHRIRREVGVHDDCPLVGVVAHLTPWKGHEFFLDVARDVTACIPDARFVVAGGSVYETHGHAGYAERLRDRAEALGLSDRVTFLGPRDDVADVLADLDVLVHCPTSAEPFGRAIAEAMAAGRPVVAARSGGIPELVDDEHTGVLVTPADRQGFAAAVVRLLRDARLRCRFGEAARARAEAMFSPDVHAAAVLDAYARLVPPERRQ